MHAPYNLATRPFRNETLPALLLAAGWVVMLAGTVAHVLAVRRLLPASTSALHQEVADLEQRIARLDERAQGFKRDVPPATLADWTFVKDLVDRRVFSWTRLLADIGQALPPGVRVTTVTPDVREGRLNVELQAVMRAAVEGLDLVRRLEESPQFSEVTPLAATESADGRQMRLRMNYDLPADPPPAARPARRAKEQR